jgi:hypothetical protein
MTAPEARPGRRPSPGRIVGAVAALTAVAGGIVGVRSCDERLPQQIGTPKSSVVNAKTIKIQPEDFDCRSETVYDTSGSTARTEYRINNHNLSFTGYGADMTSGRMVMQACAPDISIDVTTNGSSKKLVKIKLSSMAFDSQFNEANTEVLEIDPPVTQALGGAVNILSAGAREACHLAGLISPAVSRRCQVVNAVSQWNNTQAANLQRSLRVAVLEKTQQQCGPLEWKSEKAAISDAYKQQAIDQGGKANMVSVEFVDNQGRVSTATPDFTTSTLDDLYTAGTLNEQAPGSPQLVFNDVHCTALPGGYKPEYPQN